MAAIVGFWAIVEALKAIPALVGAIRELIEWRKKVESEEWFQASNEVFMKLKEAKTSEERAQRAKDITDIISRM